MLDEKKATERQRHPQKGRRYSPAEKQKILEDAAKFGRARSVEINGCSDWTIRRWQDKAAKEAEEKNRFPVKNPESMPRGKVTSSERDEAVLAMWKKHPGLGPSQIRNQLKRERGLKISTNTVRNIMEENGYVLPRTRKKEHTGRYEATRPLQLVHMDFFHFYIHRLKQCLLFILCDYSRFITGWTLVDSENVDAVIKTFESSIAKYGKPESVMSDRGSAFYSWRGIGRFTKLLDEYGIDQLIAKNAEVNGKVEALNASVDKELVRRVEFADRDDAIRQIGAWVKHYNFQRTHQALGGLLVPADRFLGCVEESLRRIEAGHGGSPLDLLAPESRGLEFFKVVSVDGNPSVYLMGKKIYG